MPSIDKNYSPRFALKIDGAEISQKDTKGAEHVVVEDHVDMIGVARFTMNLQGLSWDKSVAGKEVEASFGDDSRLVFKGYITGHRHYKQGGTETLTIIAMDPLCKLGSSRVTKTWLDKKDSDIVKDLISNAGAQAGKIDATSVTNKYLLQRNESDFNLAKRLAARNGYLLWANEGKIDFTKFQPGGSTITIEYTDIITLDYTVSAIWVPPKLTVIGWDYITKKKVEGVASSVTGIGSGQTAVQKTGQIWQKDSFVSDVQVSDQSAAEAMAKGELSRLANNYVRGVCTVQGKATLHAGVKVKFNGLRQGFNPEAFVVSSKHIVEPNTGYLTEIHFASNTHPA